MIKALRDFTLRRATRRAALLTGAAGIAVALAGGVAGVHPALAEDGLGSPIAVGDLAGIRGGDDDTNSNSHNTTNTAGSTQTTTATNEGNKIDAGGDVAAGSFTIQSGALNDNRGMTNVVVNTAPQSNAQGIMTLNLVLQ
jgi:hypothetical protein